MAEQENKARKRDGKTGASRTSLKCSPCQQEHKHTTPNEQQRSFDVIVEECEENAMQKRMIRHVVVALRKRNQPLILLNGNPGSGKTYTTLRIIRALKVFRIERACTGRMGTTMQSFPGAVVSGTRCR